METIYIDTLFFINFITDYFILLCAGKIAGARLRRGWIALGAALGGVYACLCVLPGMEFALHPLVKLAAAVGMCLTAFFREARLLRCVLIFLAVSAGFGGALWAVSILGGAGARGGVVYFPINGKVLVLTFALAYWVLTRIVGRFQRTGRQEVHTVEAVLGDRRVSFPALRDTGNSLYDPMSNSGVLVCEQQTAAALFGESAALLDAADPARTMERLGERREFAGRLRLIPFSSVGGTGLLLAVRPDRITIDGAAEDNILIAVTPNSLSAFGAYHAIY